MNKLVPIPPDSRMARDIARMEELVRVLRESLRDTPAFEQFGVRDALGAGHLTPFSKLCLTGEGQYDWQSLYGYYGIEYRGRYATQEESQNFGRFSGPQWFRVCTENRLLWAEYAPVMVRALHGMKVYVAADSWWRWDHVNARPNGRPRFIPGYQILVSASDTVFDSSTSVDDLVARVCTAADPLADTHLFDWQEDVLGATLFHSYAWTQTGFRARFATRAQVDRALAELFSPYRATVTKVGTSGLRWQVEVDLRQATGATASAAA